MGQYEAELPISRARQALTHLEDLHLPATFLVTRRNKPFARVELLEKREQLFYKTLELIEALPEPTSKKRRIASRYKHYLGR